MLRNQRAMLRLICNLLQIVASGLEMCTIINCVSLFALDPNLKTDSDTGLGMICIDNSAISGMIDFQCSPNG